MCVMHMMFKWNDCCFWIVIHSTKTCTRGHTQLSITNTNHYNFIDNWESFVDVTIKLYRGVQEKHCWLVLLLLAQQVDSISDTTWHCPLLCPDL